MTKCKHNWQAVRLEREKEYHNVEDYYNATVEYKGWLVTFVCSKCYKLKTERAKDLK